MAVSLKEYTAFQKWTSIHHGSAVLQRPDTNCYITVRTDEIWTPQHPGTGSTIDLQEIHVCTGGDCWISFVWWDLWPVGNLFCWDKWQICTGSSLSNVRICCFSLFNVTVNWIWVFGQLVKQNKHLFALQVGMRNCHYFLTFIGIRINRLDGNKCNIRLNHNHRVET